MTTFLKNMGTIIYWINPGQSRLKFQIHNLGNETMITQNKKNLNKL